MIPQPAAPTTVAVQQAAPAPPPGPTTVNVDNLGVAVFDNRSILQQALDGLTLLEFTILGNRQTSFATFYAHHIEQINTYARQYQMVVQNVANILLANMHGGGGCGGVGGPGGGGPGDGGSSASGGGGQLARDTGILALAAQPPPVIGRVSALALPPPPDPPPETAPRPKAKAKAQAKTGGVQKPIRRRRRPGQSGAAGSTETPESPRHSV